MAHWHTLSLPQSPSILHEVEEQAPEGTTGYNGSDCSMGECATLPRHATMAAACIHTTLLTLAHTPSAAICTQGWYDPDCILVPPERTGVASGGEGCYRCANGGNCTAPDFCTCTHEWQGYDCRTRKLVLMGGASVAHTRGSPAAFVGCDSGVHGRGGC